MSSKKSDGDSGQQVSYPNSVDPHFHVLNTEELTGLIDPKDSQQYGTQSSSNYNNNVLVGTSAIQISGQDLDDHDNTNTLQSTNSHLVGPKRLAILYLIFLTFLISTFFYIGPKQATTYFLDLTKQHTLQTRIVWGFLLAFSWITFCVPYWVLPLILNGFLLANEILWIPIAVNALAVICATFVSVFIAQSCLRRAIRVYLMRNYPRFLTGLKLVEKDVVLVFLLRFLIFPLGLKNYISGTLQLNTGGQQLVVQGTSTSTATEWDQQQQQQSQLFNSNQNRRGSTGYGTSGEQQVITRGANYDRDFASSDYSIDLVETEDLRNSNTNDLHSTNTLRINPQLQPALASRLLLNNNINGTRTRGNTLVAFIVSVILHAVWTSSIFSWIGKATHKMGQHITNGNGSESDELVAGSSSDSGDHESDNTHFLFFGVGITLSSCFLIVLFSRYRREFQELREMVT